MLDLSLISHDDGNTTIAILRAYSLLKSTRSAMMLDVETIYLAVLGLHWCTRAFSSCSKGGYSLLVVCWPRCGGFFSHGAWALGHVGCQLWWCMRLVAPWIWSLPRPGIEPVFPTFAGRLLTTGPPGKFHLNLDEQNSITWLLWAKRQVPVFSHLTVVMNKRNRMPVSVVNGYCLIIVYKVTF